MRARTDLEAMSREVGDRFDDVISGPEREKALTELRGYIVEKIDESLWKQFVASVKAEGPLYDEMVAACAGERE